MFDLKKILLYNFTYFNKSQLTGTCVSTYYCYYIGRDRRGIIQWAIKWFTHYTPNYEKQIKDISGKVKKNTLTFFNCIKIQSQQSRQHIYKNFGDLYNMQSSFWHLVMYFNIFQTHVPWRSELSDKSLLLISYFCKKF